MNLIQDILGGRHMPNLADLQRKATYDIFWYYYYYFLQLASNVFGWENAPKDCNMTFFECILATRSTGALVKQPFDPDPDRIFSLPYTTYWGRKNFYGYPAGKIVALTYGTHRYQFKTDNFAVLYDNALRISLEPYISMLALLCWEVHNTFRSNLRHQNKPYIITTSSKRLLSSANMWDQFSSFSPYIAVRAERPGTAEGKRIQDTFSTIDLNVPYIGKDLQDSLQQLQNMGANWLGVTSMDGKRERLVSNEADMARMGPAVTLSARLTPREEFADYCNEKWGLNMHPYVKSSGMPELQPFGSTSDNLDYLQEVERKTTEDT